MTVRRKIFGWIATGVLLLWGSMPAAAQVYSCDFESDAENSAWVRNYVRRATTLENKWYIGAPGSFGTQGKKGLYISSDADSARAVYAATGQMFTLAYRDINALTAGTYTLLFDYRLAGSESAKLHVWWLPQSVTVASATVAAPNWLTRGGIPIATALRNTPVWQSYSMQFVVPASAQPGRLVFVWESAQSTPVPPAACIDNIQIYSGSLCAAPPTDLTYSKGTVKWTGNAAQYEVCIYNSFTGTFEQRQIITGNSWTPAPTTEGMLYLYVRALCPDGGCSPWVSLSEFVYVKGARCIDFYDISDDPTATGVCYTGDFKTFVRNKLQGTRQKVDFGYASAESMHTIHYMQGETDPNVAEKGGTLATIPAGEVASVRLGAYTSSGQSARLEYKYRVLPGMSDLMELKYAAVLQSGGHGSSLTDSDMQPTLQLEVLDGNGNPLDVGCTQFTFMPGFGATANWHFNPNDEEYGRLYWCDWTTVTVSLRPYVGQTLTIRLTAARCSFDTHFAYTYFTLGCRSGDLQGIACGDFSTDRFVAPEGFSYLWYKETESRDNPILNAQGETNYDTLHIDVKDTAVYMLECHNLEDYSCYYVLTANPNPRFPKAKADNAKQEVKDCQHIVTFTQDSYIAIINRLDYSATRSEEPLQEIIWNFGDGSQPLISADTVLTHNYPPTGGDYVPYVVASMSNGVCKDTLWLDTLHLANLLSANVDTVVHRCEGEGYELPQPSGKTVFADTLYRWQTKNDYGCDVENSLQLRYHAPAQSTQTEELCEGGYIDFEGQRYTETGVYDVRLKTIYGCDSLLRLNLTVLPRLSVQVPDTLIACADAPFVNLPYRHLAGRLSGVAVHFPAEAVAQGMDSLYEFLAGDEVNIPLVSNLRPEDYVLTIDFGAPDCPAEPVAVVLRIYYASSVIEQKNDLIALLNDQYNGGYQWAGYQWYRNGVPIPDANTSYIVVDDSQLGDEFYCVLLRTDGVQMPTCPITYVGGKTAAVSDAALSGWVYPTIVKPLQTIHIAGAKRLMIVDMLGRIVREQTLSPAATSATQAPACAGVYSIVTDHYATKIIVR